MRIVTGGDDGQVSEAGQDGEHRVLGTDDKKRWIDNVAIGPDGAIAWSAGKIAHVRTKKGELRTFEAASTVAGLCFFPKGFVLRLRTTTARRSGFRTRPVFSPSGSNGRARISG